MRIARTGIVHKDMHTKTVEETYSYIVRETKTKARKRRSIGRNTAKKSFGKPHNNSG